jgi:hypothetical protein
MTYDTMSVKALVLEAFSYGTEIGPHGGFPELTTIEEIVDAIKVAVTREASVGTVYVARDYDDGCPEFRFKCPERTTGLVKDIHVCKLCGELMPEREYALVPSNLISKETP